MIELITASAGSGKTYTLAKKYIGILLDAYVKDHSKDTREFEHILAVTFTNKATAEMKDRILQELYILSQNPVLSDYYEEFCKKYGKAAVSDPKMWKSILFTLLHNYSRFSVSTIDTFFQSVLRHFAREIGEFDSYRIELDRDALVSEAADNLLSGISSDQDPVFKVVSSLTSEKIGDGKKFSPKRELTEIATELMGGEFISVLKGLESGSAYDDLMKEIKKEEPKFGKRVDELQTVLKAEGKQAVEESVECAKNLLTIIDGYNDGKKYVKETVRRGIEKYSVNCADLSESCLDALKGDSNKLFNGKALNKERFLAENGPMMNRLVSLYVKKKRVAELLKYIPHLKFSVSVFKAFAEVTDSANVKCLEDTTKLLSEIIAGSDAPFIYEKIGTRFDHYLLDEFQDTSHVQWENFKPLLVDSNSRNGQNLVVGDVKQSIYRFRNSDYTILDSEVPEEFAEYVENIPLDSNFRSGIKIVDFNNDLFAVLAEKVDGIINGGGGKVLQDIYLKRDADGSYHVPHTVGQIAKKGFDGYVHFERFCGDDTEGIENMIYPQVVSIVKDLCARGVKKKDILILVKGKMEGARIAEDLLREGIGVYSDDSLFISSNAIARKLLSVLRYMDNNKDLISKAVVDELGEGFLDEDGTIAYSTLVDLIENVIAKLKDVYCNAPERNMEFSGSVPYLSSLVDLASAYETDYGNSLHGFLEYFDRKDAKIASTASEETVQIMTIHKSKGLSGEFVIVPFVNKFVLYDTRHNRKWSGCDDVPLPAGSHDFAYYASLSKTHRDSVFYGSYVEEEKQRGIDAMNLLYVAFTRAQHGLYILEGKTGRQDDNLGRIAAEYLLGADGMTYELGDLAGTVGDYLTPKTESDSAKKELLDGLRDQKSKSGEYSVFKSRAAVRNSIKAQEFFDGLRQDGDECVSDSKLKGVLQHAILSVVRTVDDVDAAVEDKWQEGVLDGTKEDAKSYLKAKINTVSKYGWFAPEATIVTEEGMLVKVRKLQKNGDGFEETPVATRLLPDGEKEYIVCRRPDRIVVHSDGRVDIVDYKFTGEAQSNLSRYRQQVLAYCRWYRALPGCENKDVTGYIWYVNADEDAVVKIENQASPL